jgi:hypothetical protein
MTRPARRTVANRAAVPLPAVSDATPKPVDYAKAVAAIATCEHLDEVKHWADRAEALRSYARQTRRGDELEAIALRLRARAYRRAGALLSQVRAQGARTAESRQHTRQHAGREAGFSVSQSTLAVQVAALAEAEFEALVEGARPPGVVKLGRLSVAARTGAMPRPRKRYLGVPTTPGEALARARDLLAELLAVYGLLPPSHRQQIRDSVVRAFADTVDGGGDRLRVSRRSVAELRAEVFGEP